MKTPITIGGYGSTDSVVVTLASGATVEIFDQGQGVPRVFVRLPSSKPFDAFGQTLVTVIASGKDGADARAHLSVSKSSFGPEKSSLTAKPNVPKRGSDVEKLAIMPYWK